MKPPKGFFPERLHSQPCLEPELSNEVQPAGFFLSSVSHFALR